MILPCDTPFTSGQAIMATGAVALDIVIMVIFPIFGIELDPVEYPSQ